MSSFSPAPLKINVESRDTTEDSQSNSPFFSSHSSPTTPSSIDYFSSNSSFINEEQLSPKNYLEPNYYTENNLKAGLHYFNLLKLLGEGAFGKVLLVQNRMNKKYYAMKVISKSLLKKKNNVEYMKSERNILIKLNFPFLIKMHFSFQTQRKLFLVFDFLCGGEFFYLIKKNGVINEKNVQFYLAEIILTINYLHSNKIIHRDIKPENILLQANGHICLTDFGLAKDITNEKNFMTKTLCGTNEYMAPEMITRTGYSYSVDWWSLGVLTYEMLTGKVPFFVTGGSNTKEKEKELEKKIMYDKLILPNYLNQKTMSLLKGLLEKDPSKRLGCSKGNMFTIGGISALKQHPFFENLDWYELLNLRIDPPFNLEEIAAADREKEKKNNKNQKQTPLASNNTDADGQISSDMLRFFNKEFTSQNVSPSLIEESYLSFEKNNQITNSIEDNYEDFEYTSSDFFISESDYTNFLKNMDQKLVHFKKKKLLRNKKEQEKQLELERKIEEEKIRNEKLLEEKLKNERKLQRNKLILSKKVQLKEINELKTKYLQTLSNYNALVTPIEKKLKNTRKKLKEISDLKDKISRDKSIKLDKDQEAKLKRETELETEIKKLEKDILHHEANLKPQKFSVPSNYTDIYNEFYYKDSVELELESILDPEIVITEKLYPFSDEEESTNENEERKNNEEKIVESQNVINKNSGWSSKLNISTPSLAPANLTASTPTSTLSSTISTSTDNISIEEDEWISAPTKIKRR